MDDTRGKRFDHTPNRRRLGRIRVPSFLPRMKRLQAELRQEEKDRRVDPPSPRPGWVEPAGRSASTLLGDDSLRLSGPPMEFAAAVLGEYGICQGQAQQRIIIAAHLGV